MEISNLLKKMEIDFELIGDGKFDSLGLLGSEYEGSLCSFIVDKKYKDSISSSVKLLLVTPIEKNDYKEYDVCVVENPRIVFFELHNFLSDSSIGYKRKKHASKINSSAKISDLAYIAEHNVIIGKNVVIEEFVSIKENTVIGDNTIIRAGTIVGGEGFEHKHVDNEILSIKHRGGVIIGENVEIQQNNTIDKAIYPWDNTVIGEYCKTDNLVHIAHGVKMKKRILIAAKTCVAGRVSIGNDVWIGPGVTLINGMSIGDNARVNIGSVATKDVSKNEHVTGNFAIEHSKFIDDLKNKR